MKRILTAAAAAFLLLFSLCVTAHAAVGEGSDTQTGTDYPTESVAENPFTPAGTGTVVDTATDGDGKVFYTIVTPDESVFYLVIDRQRGAENVYFLNAVTVNDLLPLAATPDTKQPENPNPVPPTPPLDPLPDTIPASEQGDGNMGTYIFIVVLAVLGGGAGWYFKIYRPKQQGAAADEYEPPTDTDESGYDVWDEDDDTDDDGGDPPWGEDGEDE